MAGPFLQMALEEAPNYEGGANAVSSDVFYIPLKSFEDDDGAEMLEENDLMLGSLASQPHRGAGSYKPAPKMVEIHPRMSHMPLLLAACWGAIDTDAGVAGAGVLDPDSAQVPIGAWRHVISEKAADPPQSCQLVARTGDGKFRKTQGAAISELAAKFLDNGALVLDATMVALVLASIADPSITPVMDDAYPLRRGDMALTWLANSAYTNDFDFTITSPAETKFELGIASLYPTLLQFTNDGTPGIAGTIAKSSIADADIAALLAGTQFAALIKLVGRETIKRAAVNVTSSSVAAQSVITCAAPHNLPAGTSTVVIAGHTGSTPSINGTHVATKIDATTFSIPVNVSVGGTGGTEISDTAYYPKLWIDMPGCQLVKVDRDAIAKQRRREGKWNWEARYDPTTAKLATITVVNDVAAYDTYA